MNQQAQSSSNQKPPAAPKWLWITLIVVAVLGGFFTAWYLLMGPGKKVASSTATTTPATTIDPTADWLTYTNTANSFTAKYPTTWSTQEKTSNSQVLFRNDKLTTNYDKSNTPATYESVTMSYADNDCSAAKEVVDAAGGSEKATVTNPAITNTAVTMKSYQYSSGDGPYISAYWQNTAGKRFCAFSYMRTDDTVKNENINVFKNMLSTFKFTTAASATSTADWKTYTNTDYGFSLKYPKDWALVEDEASTIFSMSNASVIIGLNENGYTPREGTDMPNSATIELYPNIAKLDSQTLNPSSLKNYLDKYSTLSDPVYKTVVQKKIGELSGYQALAGPNQFGGGIYYFIELSNKQIVKFWLFNDSNSVIMDNILSTFQFTQ